MTGIRIGFAPDSLYEPQSREHTSADLAEVTRADLRWYYFLGRVSMGDDGTEIGPPWGWVPLFDFLYNLREVLEFSKGGSALGLIDFTENAERIDFALRGDSLIATPSYQEAVLQCPVSEFVAEGRRFIRAELARVVQQHPRITHNPHVRDLAESLLASVVQVAWGLVTDRAGVCFLTSCPFAFGSGDARSARRARVRTGSDRAGRASFRVAGIVRAGQVSAGRAQSRCQQARNASAHGQSALTDKTRWRAWWASFAGRCQTR